MLELLSEQPLLISLMLGLFAAAFIYGWMQTGKREVAIAGIVTLLLIPVVWVASSMFVSDRKQIEQLIYEVAADIEAENYDKVYQYISNPQSEAQARQELPMYMFSMAKVNSIRSIDLVQGSYPPEADVDMTVKVDVSTRNGSIQDLRVARRLLLRLQKNDAGLWRVVQYQHLPMVGGPDQFSSVMPPRS